MMSRRSRKATVLLLVLVAVSLVTAGEETPNKDADPLLEVKRGLFKSFADELGVPATPGLSHVEEIHYRLQIMQLFVNMFPKNHNLSNQLGSLLNRAYLANWQSFAYHTVGHLPLQRHLTPLLLAHKNAVTHIIDPLLCLETKGEVTGGLVAALLAKVCEGSTRSFLKHERNTALVMANTGVRSKVEMLESHLKTESSGDTDYDSPFDGILGLASFFMSSTDRVSHFSSKLLLGDQLLTLYNHHSLTTQIHALNGAVEEAHTSARKGARWMSEHVISRTTAGKGLPSDISFALSHRLPNNVFSSEENYQKATSLLDDSETSLEILLTPSESCEALFMYPITASMIKGSFKEAQTISDDCLRHCSNGLYGAPPNTDPFSSLLLPNGTAYPVPLWMSYPLMCSSFFGAATQRLDDTKLPSISTDRLLTFWNIVANTRHPQAEILYHSSASPSLRSPISRLSANGFTITEKTLVHPEPTKINGLNIKTVNAFPRKLHVGTNVDKESKLLQQLMTDTPQPLSVFLRQNTLLTSEEATLVVSHFHNALFVNSSQPAVLIVDPLLSSLRVRTSQIPVKPSEKSKVQPSASQKQVFWVRPAPEPMQDFPPISLYSKISRPLWTNWEIQQLLFASKTASNETIILVRDDFHNQKIVESFVTNHANIHFYDESKLSSISINNVSTIEVIDAATQTTSFSHFVQDEVTKRSDLDVFRAMLSQIPVLPVSKPTSTPLDTSDFIVALAWDPMTKSRAQNVGAFMQVLRATFEELQQPTERSSACRNPLLFVSFDQSLLHKPISFQQKLVQFQKSSIYILNSPSLLAGLADLLFLTAFQFPQKATKTIPEIVLVVGGTSSSPIDALTDQEKIHLEAVLVLLEWFRTNTLASSSLWITHVPRALTSKGVLVYEKNASNQIASFVLDVMENRVSTECFLEWDIHLRDALKASEINDILPDKNIRFNISNTLHQLLHLPESEEEKFVALSESLQNDLNLFAQWNPHDALVHMTLAASFSHNGNYDLVNQVVTPWFNRNSMDVWTIHAQTYRAHAFMQSASTMNPKKAEETARWAIWTMIEALSRIETIKKPFDDLLQSGSNFFSAFLYTREAPTAEDTMRFEHDFYDLEDLQRNIVDMISISMMFLIEHKIQTEQINKFGEFIMPNSHLIQNWSFFAHLEAKASHSSPEVSYFLARILYETHVLPASRGSPLPVPEALLPFRPLGATVLRLLHQSFNGGFVHARELIDPVVLSLAKKPSDNNNTSSSSNPETVDQH